MAYTTEMSQIADYIPLLKGCQSKLCPQEYFQVDQMAETSHDRRNIASSTTASVCILPFHMIFKVMQV